MNLEAMTQLTRLIMGLQGRQSESARPRSQRASGPSTPPGTINP